MLERELAIVFSLYLNTSLSFLFLKKYDAFHKSPTIHNKSLSITYKLYLFYLAFSKAFGYC